jgi:hypothetical protein
MKAGSLSETTSDLDDAIDIEKTFLFGGFKLTFQRSGSSMARTYIVPSRPQNEVDNKFLDCAKSLLP